MQRRRPRRSQRRHRRQASSSTQRPIGTMRPRLLGERDELERGRAGPAAGAASARGPRRRRSGPLRGRRSAGSGGRTRSRSSGAPQVRLELDPVARPPPACPARRSRSGPCPSPWRGTSPRRRCGATRPRPPRRVLTAMPMLAVRKTSLPPSVNGRPQRPRDALGDLVRARRRRTCPRAAARTRRRRGAPRCRRRGCSRAAGARPRSRTWSPAAWPRLSLIALKSSRSRRRTAHGWPSRRLRAQGVLDAVGQEGAVRRAPSGDHGTPGASAAPRERLRSWMSRIVSDEPWIVGSSSRFVRSPR